MLAIGYHPRPGLPNQEIKEVSGRYDKGCVRDGGQSPHPFCLLLQDESAGLPDCNKALVAQSL